jgi:acyl carrier protein
MTEQEIFAKLSEILKDINEDVEVTNETALIAEGILDSLELINYLTQIEEHFNIEISLEQLKDEKLGVVGNMVQYLSKSSY